MWVNLLRKFVIGTAALLLTGCISTLWTGASLFYDRHNVYKKIDDYQLAVDAQALLFDDARLKNAGAQLEIAVFNGDVLVVGHVPNEAIRVLVQKRLAVWKDPRTVYNQVTVNAFPPDSLTDTWITAKIRSQMLSDVTVNPKAFKIVTYARRVYVMGDIQSEQAGAVLDIARSTQGVQWVVKLLRYYRLEELGKKIQRPA